MRAENMDPANYALRCGSASPNVELQNDRVRALSVSTVKDPCHFPSTYASNEPVYGYDDYVKPGPASPGLLAPYNGMSSAMNPKSHLSMQSFNHHGSDGRTIKRAGPGEAYLPGTYAPKPCARLSQSPLSASRTLIDPRPSVSPTQSVRSLTQKNSSTTSASDKRKKPRRKAHNAIEKRYRIRLNEKIAELRDSIPSLRQNPGSPFHGSPKTDQGGLCDVTSVHKVNKANVLEKATEYIKSLELCNRRLQVELHRVLNLSRGVPPARPIPPMMNYPMLENGHDDRSTSFPGHRVTETCTRTQRDH